MKAEDGYRIVTAEEREKYAYPLGCRVRWRSLTDIAGEPWDDSDCDVGWDDKWAGLYIFAVPDHYVFAEDRKCTDEREVDAEVAE